MNVNIILNYAVICENNTISYLNGGNHLRHKWTLSLIILLIYVMFWSDVNN